MQEDPAQEVHKATAAVGAASARAGAAAERALGFRTGFKGLRAPFGASAAPLDITKNRESGIGRELQSEPTIRIFHL